VLRIPELVRVDCALREGAHISECCAHSSKCARMIVMYIYVYVFRSKSLYDYWVDEPGHK